MILTKDGRYIYRQEEAEEALEEIGIDSYNHEEFINLLSDNLIDTLYDRIDDYEDRADDYERVADSYRTALVDILNLVDDVLAAPRLTKSREKFESIHKLINEYI